MSVSCYMCIMRIGSTSTQLTCFVHGEEAKVQRHLGRKTLVQSHATKYKTARFSLDFASEDPMRNLSFHSGALYPAYWTQCSILMSFQQSWVFMQ